MRWLLWASVVTALTGCHAFHVDIDGRIEQRASAPIDMQASALDGSPRLLRPEPTAGMETRIGSVAPQSDILHISWETETPQPNKDKQDQKSMLDRLQPPETLLGVKVPDIQMAPSKATDVEKDAFFKKQFPPLQAIPKLPEPKLGRDGRAMTLNDLQQIALRTNPTIRQAHQEIQAARGAALQAGLYPNPSIGYEGSTVGQGNENGVRSPGQEGGFIAQTIVTAGKLTIARQAALQEVQISEQRLKQTEADVQANVRRGYFAVLSAQKKFETSKALAQLTDELYDVLLLQMKIGEVAAYEPMQIRVLALEARVRLVQAHNRYISAWRQLAATLGTPGEPLTAVAGKIDMPVPHFDHDAVLAYVLANHTDVLAAQQGVYKARFLERLAEVQPIPDLAVYVAFQKDYTTPPYGLVANVGVGVPVPFWNRNQGNIQAARAMVGKAQAENLRVRNELTGKIAEAFERYDNNRTLLVMYKTQILPNQVQAFRAGVARHAAVGDKTVSYNDLVIAQQTLEVLIHSYLGVLSEQWVATVDIAHLLQTRDLFQMQALDDVAPIPDVYELYRERPLRRR